MERDQASQGTGGGSPGPPIEGYRDFQRIATGGFSTVYTAHQERFARTVAVKVLGTNLGDANALRRFTRECQASGRLSHLPEVITVYDAGATADDRPFIAMQYFPRGSLADRIHGGNQLSVLEAVGVGVSVSCAVAAAHDAKITHRDVKPGNLLVSDDGCAVLSDFGVASIRTDSEESVSLDAFTPVHCAPEVLDGLRYSPAADIYAFGSTLYTLLTGTAPFAPQAGDGPATLIRRILAGDAAELDPAVAEPLRLLIKSMMAVDPQQRPTAVSLVQTFNSLRDLLGSEPLARPVPAGDDLDPDTPRLAHTPRLADTPPLAPGFREAVDTPTKTRARRTPMPPPVPVPAGTGSGHRRLRRAWLATAAGAAAVLVVIAVLAAVLRGGTDTAQTRTAQSVIPSVTASPAPGGTDPAPSGDPTSAAGTISPAPSNSNSGSGSGSTDAAPANPDSLPPPVSAAAAPPAVGPSAAGPPAAGPADPQPRASSAPSVSSAPAQPAQPAQPAPSTAPQPQPASVGSCPASSESINDYAGRHFPTIYTCSTYVGSAVYANVRSNQASEDLDDSGYMDGSAKVWVLCQYQGRSNPVIQGNTNTWWLYTQGDSGNSNTHGYTGAWGYLPATAVSQGGQNEPIPGVPSCQSYY
ncbi:serine/threonine-protein kinase [Frankia sp. Cas4]|uniref:serine/threonine-protein kinase n=1 Tax=Frankia sp. Cas4 TaxID=3073927 RepID=UPI002AD43A5E|nr:serine/threonine-protein kinase [Frankia sp. Cas4]